MYAVTGANLFGQWFEEDQMFVHFKDLPPTKPANGCDFEINRGNLVHIGWSYNIFEIDDEYYVTGAWHGNENQIIKLSLPGLNEDSSKSTKMNKNIMVTGNDYSLLVINKKTHYMWIIDLEDENKVRKIKFQTEKPHILKESQRKKLRSDEHVIRVVFTNHNSNILTSKGTLYSGFLPSLLVTNHCMGTVIDIQSGYEHYILLTDAGSVYTWGNGRRLQLGHGNLNNIEIPTEVEALAGIKIVKIAAGGWHSLALSEFGDLYAWGWNDTGQLGIRDKSEDADKSTNSYPIPTVVDLFDENDKGVCINIKDIACGSKHSAILDEDNTAWATGNNKYGQLALSPNVYSNIYYFKKVHKFKSYRKLMCGPWSTVILS